MDNEDCNTICVELTLSDGEVVKGYLLRATGVEYNYINSKRQYTSANIISALNSNEMFIGIYIKTFNPDKRYFPRIINKFYIKNVEIIY